MPYKSDKQRRFMHWKHPEIAQQWDQKYGGKVVPKGHLVPRQREGSSSPSLVGKNLSQLGEVTKAGGKYRWVMPASGTQVIRQGLHGLPKQVPEVSATAPRKFRFMEDPTGYRQLIHNQRGLRENRRNRNDWDMFTNRRSAAQQGAANAYSAVNRPGAPPQTLGHAAGNQRLAEILEGRANMSARRRRDADLSDVSRTNFRNAAIPKVAASTTVGGGAGGFYGWGKYEQNKQRQRAAGQRGRKVNQEAETDNEQRNYVMDQYQQGIADSQRKRGRGRLS